MSKITIHIEPIGKPRMTQRDKWARRPVVLRWFDFKDQLKAACIGQIPEGTVSVSWKAYISMPKSWSAKRKREMEGTPHFSKPDRDNIDKGILDSLFHDDSHIYHGVLTKLWDDGKGARLELEFETW